MRNTSLHAALEAYAAQASRALSAELARGAEIPFEVERSASGRGRGRPALYCYRPLTELFVSERRDLLQGLPGYAAATGALAHAGESGRYLALRGVSAAAVADRPAAEAVLGCLLEQLFAERSEFSFDRERFEQAYAELESGLYEERSLTTVIAPVLGLALEHGSQELVLGDGLTLARGDAMPDVPPEALWGAPGLEEAGEPHVLAVLTIERESGGRPPLPLARSRFRRVLTALRLFERGAYALGPLAWARTDAGAWRAVASGASGRAGLLTLLSADQQAELRSFWELLGRRMPASGELAWALARFEMGCERIAPFDALTDYLLALRALLEPEGPHTARLAQRLAVLCATPDRQARLAERAAQAVALEQAVIRGLTGAGDQAGALVQELSEHLRALLRDVICGHLDADLRAVADGLLAEAALAA